MFGSNQKLKSILNTYFIQVILLSATMPADVMDVTTKFMRDPKRILVNKDELTLEGIRQFYVYVEKEDWKMDTLCDIYETLTITQVRIQLVFFWINDDCRVELQSNIIPNELIKHYMINFVSLGKLYNSLIRFKRWGYFVLILN